jgi:LDH2 family malate/lactate/ureidoglycolate dehydrogenase
MDEFKREMDEYVRGARRMQPFPGYDRADLPGGLEWEREREWAMTGIPVGPGHRTGLEEIAGELGVDVPWSS